MAPLTLRSRLLLAFAYVLLLAVVALLVPLVRSVRSRVDAEVRTQALAQAELVAASVPGITPAAVAALARTAGDNVRGRVLVVGPAGRVRADSASTSTRGASYAGRPEIAAALRGRVDQVQRHSASLGQSILATAVPVLVAGRPRGAVRITQSVAAVHRAVTRASLGLGLIGALVLAIGLAAGAVVAAELARPLHRLAATARRVTAGDLGVRADEHGSAEQRDLARAFNDMTQRLAHLLAVQREFVADASHQLRTPLAGMRLRLEEAGVAAGDGDAGTQVRGALAEVDRLSHMVGELLVLSEAGDAPKRTEEVDLAAAGTAACRRWEAAAAASGARVVASATPRAGTARCGRADLDRVLDALVENALAYGPPGQTVRLVADERRVEVHDEGRGPAQGEEEAVFARFHRGSAGRAGPAGTGLGLPIARELARRWGGDVTLAADGDGGVATVTFGEES